VCLEMLDGIDNWSSVFVLSEIAPSREAVFERQGIVPGGQVSDKVEDIYEEAGRIFTSTAGPEALVSEISTADFAEIYRGEGNNAGATPLDQIYPQASRLSLFIFTLGSQVSSEIERLFSEDDFALGYMLDTVASLAAENAVEVLESLALREVTGRDRLSSDFAVLAYSPGYCGWHITAQRKLFDYLDPSRIGVSLNESCLMTPLKSCSGVLVGGAKEIHMFDRTFSFCQTCRSCTCRERIKGLRAA
jgi:hypothetical protein